ncbi:MAG: cytochrome c biogenesis protein ResB [Desulfobacteraceae bacterium]|nr:cytochrome c biogenesis protein ResB [Desulfobacteraceae bacterium]
MSQDDGFIAKILSILASLKLTLFVFFALAGASVIGTLLPQGMGSAELESQFSPTMALIIDRLSLNNLYHSGWFRVLLLLLCMNLLACTLDRLPKTVRLLKREDDSFTAEKIARFSHSRTFVTEMKVDQAAPMLRFAVEEVFGPIRVLKDSDTFCAVSEKGRWSRLMVYGVHLSVLVVLAGAIMGSVFGFKGFMNLPEGESADEVILGGGGGHFILLPFKIRCDKFDVSFYDTGLPKDYRSDLSILEDNREVLKESIRVNDPLTYKGVTFYQASYGNMLKTAELVLTDRESGKTMSMIVPFQQVRNIPGTDDVLRISEYQESFMNFGPALGIVVGKGGPENVAGSWILVNRPDFHGNKVHNYQIRVMGTERVSYTGLQVKKDPGVVLVWVGFSLMIIGIGLTFYSSHKKIWVCVESNGERGGSLVAIAGRASRDVQGFEEKFAELSKHLEDRLPT